MEMNLRSVAIALGVLLASAPAVVWVHRRASAATLIRGGPYSNQTIALSWDDSELAVANPSANTVSIFLVQGDQNAKGAEVPVGKEPTGVAFSPDGARLYVANQVDGTVGVLSQGVQGYTNWSVTGTIPVGVEPHGMVLSASGRKLYVTNTRSNSVSVIDITTNTVTSTITNVGPEPRGIAITHGPNATDSNQVVYVTDFLALPSGNGHPDGFDDAKTGFVTAISVATDSVISTIQLGTVADTGFKADGDALQHIAPPANPATTDFTFTTGAYPNQLNSLATHGNFAYLPSTGASPNGPVRFNVNTQSLVSVINLATNQDAGQTINIQSAVGSQSNATKLFVTQPWAIAFKNSSDVGYVVSAASDIVAKLAVDPSSGKPTVQMDPSDSTRVLEIPVGKNPRGIVINSADTRAYVTNYSSRDVSVIDLTQSPEKVLATLTSTALPQPGTLADTVHIGEQLFHSSVGVFDPPATGQPAITGRMSNNGWGSCGSCHPNGLSDNVVWIFASGPRRTVPLHATFAAGDPTQQRALNWSAIFDDVEDFEGNIRNVSGGLGLFVQADGVTPTTTIPSLTAHAAGLKQLTVRGVNAWDAIKAYVQHGIRAPLSPASKTDPDVVAGQALFTQANCQSCHGTSQWTTSRVRYTPPPDSSLVQNTELIGELRQVGTFNSKALNEVRATAAAPLGTDGFNPPSLLSLFAFPQTFFHNGSVATLNDVLANTAHRTAGSGGTDYLTSPTAVAQLVKFLLSIDANTQPINPPASHLNSGGIINNASGVLGVAGVTPGSIASIYGTGLALTPQPAAAVPLPKSLGGAVLTVGNALAAFFYASPNQLNVQIPWETPLGSATATSTVGNSSSTTTVNVVQYAPGIYTTAQTGSGQGIIVGPTNGIAAPTGAFPGSQPVKVGDFVTIYCTGLGPVANQPATGAVATASPLPSTPIQATATIGGLPAAVNYSGLTPSAVGLYQVNAQVPAGVVPGNAVPVVIAISGVSSNSVTIAVTATSSAILGDGRPADGRRPAVRQPPIR
jgi:uncharacterized protein (TIGR03437 family)